jgi:hypothetical protein
MGIFGFFKKSNLGSGSKLEVKETEAETDSSKKKTFLIRYAFVHRDPSNKDFKNKSCYKFKFSDGSEISECAVCQRVMGLDKFWSRTEIETLSRRLGYSVFENPGGAVDSSGNPICGCKWESQIVSKK